MVPSSTQSARCSGDISLEIPGQASARPTSSEIGSLVLVCSAIMPFTKSRAVCSSELERMATELRQKSWIHRASSGGTRCPTSTRNRPLARPGRSVQAAYLRRDRLTIHDGFQRSADQTDPNPPEPHRRPSQSPQRH